MCSELNIEVPTHHKESSDVITVLRVVLLYDKFLCICILVSKIFVIYSIILFANKKLYSILNNQLDSLIYITEIFCKSTTLDFLYFSRIKEEILATVSI